MREEEKLLSGILFSPGMPELRAIKRIAHNSVSYTHLTLPTTPYV